MEKRLTTASEARICPLYLRLDPGDIAFVKFLFESYEEVAIVRTIDRQVAIIVVLAVEDFLADARAILRDICAKIVCEEIARPADNADDWLMREMDEY